MRAVLLVPSIDSEHLARILPLSPFIDYGQAAMNPLGDRFGDAKRAVSAPAEASARRLNDEDARFVLE
jgi:hypothetical protein